MNAAGSESIKSHSVMYLSYESDEQLFMWVALIIVKTNL